MTTSLRFTKMSGSGNDFIMVDNRDGQVAEADASNLAQRLSRHRLSVGADGIVLLTQPPEMPADVDYVWRYVNADGSDGEMCGNGAMCAARFSVDRGIAPIAHRFLTPSGIVQANVDVASGRVSLDMVEPGPVEPAVAITVCGRTLSCTRILVGVPHVVTIVEDADLFASTSEFDEIGKAVRHHPAFAPAGTNLNVVSRISSGHWRMRTYERGVEAETLACGTGAVASAIVLGALMSESSPIRIRTSGGRDLDVSYEWSEERATHVRLTGHAALVYDGELLEDALID